MLRGAHLKYWQRFRFMKLQHPLSLAMLAWAASVLATQGWCSSVKLRQCNFLMMLPASACGKRGGEPRTQDGEEDRPGFIRRPLMPVAIRSFEEHSRIRAERSDLSWLHYR